MSCCRVVAVMSGKAQTDKAIHLGLHGLAGMVASECTKRPQNRQFYLFCGLDPGLYQGHDPGDG